MRILKEKYTPEEVEQRVTEVRNAIGSLQDSLYILISALDDIGDFRRSYVQDYVEQVEDLGANFEKDFEDIIYPKQEYDDEEFEESLSEDTIKTKDGKWTNKGDTGETHGKFKTKKEADAQRRAMFANGFKG